MPVTYKVGVVGSGFGAKAHVPAFMAHPRFDVVAIASPNRAAEVANERNIPRSFANCAELLAGCDVDVVDVAGPPFTHRDDVIAALCAGKHVICEKPFALNVPQAQEMVAAAEAAHTATAVMHEFRWVPQRVALKELVDNGHLQPLREIEITQLGGFLRLQATRPNSWWFDRHRGGGLAGALLSHVIDNANWLAGRPPRSTVGMLRTANPARRDANGAFTSTVDDGAFALLDYGDGVVGRLTADSTTAIESFTAAVHGEQRTAVASGAGMTELQLFVVDEHETSELECTPSPYASFASINGNVPLIMQLLDEFVKQIETGTSMVPTFAQALETQRVLEALGYGKPLDQP